MSGIEKSKFLIGKSLEEIEISHALTREISELTEVAVLSGETSMTTLGMGMSGLRNYLACMSHIPAGVERIKKSPEYVDNKRNEAMGYGSEALEELSTSFATLTTFMQTTSRAKSKAGSKSTGTVVGHVLRMKGYFEEMGLPETSALKESLDDTVNVVFARSLHMTGELGYARTASEEGHEKMSAFMPRLEKSVTLLGQSKDIPADQAAAVLEAASAQVGEEDLGLLRDIGAHLTFGLQSLERGEQERQGLRVEFLLIKTSFEMLRNDL